MIRHHFIEATLRGFTQALSRALTSEELAQKHGLLQSFDPRVRLIGVLALVIAVTACRQLDAVATLFGFAILIALTSRVRLHTLVYRIWLVVFGFTGFIALPAVFFTPGTPIAHIFGASITEQGLRAAVLLLLRVGTAVTLTATLVLTTPWTHILKALRTLRVPTEVITMLAMTHRYIFLLIETAGQMFESRQSRIVGRLSNTEQRRLATRTVGVLLNKSIDLSNEVYLAMQSRGFRGDIRLIGEFRMQWRDYAAMAWFLGAAITWIWIGK